MTRLFPRARDYRTVSVQISPQQLAKIEERSQTTVLPGQREQFQYYEMLNSDGELIGYTQAMTQRGEFGAIEFVFGISKELEIIEIYIQRSRERHNQFREESFLSYFIGKNISQAEELEDPLGENGNAGTKAIVTGLKKALIAYDELVLKKSD